MAVERRSLFKILGAGLATHQAGIGQEQHEHGSTSSTGASYTPRALSAAEYRVVDRLVDVILPADETSPGAHDAGVARYIDIVLLYGDQKTLASWQRGIESVDAAAKEAHGMRFDEIPRQQQTEIVQRMAANEANPVTETDTFFVAVKRLAIEAYYLSAAGRQSLGYKGDTAVKSFPGCTDPEHKA
jgi:hypothetical protein